MHVLHVACLGVSWYPLSEHAVLLLPLHLCPDGHSMQLVALLREVLPSFVPGEVRTLPCMVAYTPSGLPYVDRVDERIGIAVGGNACGVMTSDELGRLAAAMMRDAPWTGPLGAELFSARFA